MPELLDRRKATVRPSGENEGAVSPDNGAGGCVSIRRSRGVYYLEARYAKAEQAFEKVLATDEKTLGAKNLETGKILSNMATISQALGKTGEAESLYQRAQDIMEPQAGSNHPLMATLYENRARLFVLTHRYAEAERQFQKSIASWEVCLGPDHPRIGALLRERAAALRKSGGKREARSLETRAMEIETLNPARKLAGNTIDVNSLLAPGK